MTRTIDLTRSVFELTEQNPELLGVLKDLGFLGIVNPVMRGTVGRVMTIPMGCEKMGIDLEMVKEALRAKGFEIKE